MSTPEWQKQVWKLTDDAERENSKGRFDRAVAHYRKALALVPEPKKENAEAACVLLNMAESRFLQRDFAATLAIVEEAREYTHADTDGRRLREGQCRYELGQHEEARRILSDLFERKGDLFFRGERDAPYLTWLQSP